MSVFTRNAKRMKVVSLTLVAALMSLPIFSAPASGADISGRVAPEPLARQMVTSPQTSGPVSAPTGYQGLPWGLDRIDQRSNTLDGSYSFPKTGVGVKVYVVDAGVNAAHTDAFGQRVVGGWSYRSSATSLASYGNQIDAGYFAPCSYDPVEHQVDPSQFDRTLDADDKGTLDNDGHGTHVAGIIGGEFTGVAKEVTIVPVRVLDSCGVGTATMVGEGLQWVLDNHADGEPAVVNMSIGFEISAVPIDAKIRQMIAEGIVVVAASGNSATTSCNSTPAGTPGTISVGAIDSSSRETGYSNYGLCVDVFAPGSDIVSSWPKSGVLSNTYLVKSGTSMAAPFVTGAVAQFLQGQTATANTPDVTWAWLKTNSTCDAVTYFNTARAASDQTPNRLINLGSLSPSACRPIFPSAVPGSQSATVSWQKQGGDETGVTYLVTAAPGGATCTTTATSCVVTGLVNSQPYTFSIVASNQFGTASSVDVSATPDGPPEVPSVVQTSVKNRSLTVTWPAVTTTLNVTYVAIVNPGNIRCVTAATLCTFEGLTNGREYSIALSTVSPTGLATTSLQTYVARPGFTVLTTAVKRRSQTTLSKIVKSVSPGRKTWTESGSCSIKSGKLVAPKTKTKCKVRLRVAKSGKFPAMSTLVVVTIT